MRILVTGASGFVGRSLCALLLEQGHDVAALVRREGSQPPRTRALSGDLGDYPQLAALLERERPDCVVHLAAEIASQRSERKLREVNVDGTARLLDVCVTLGERPDRSSPKFAYSRRPSSPATPMERCSARISHCPYRPRTGAASRRASGSCASPACPPS
jgi:nucleoside-diphosphate-sugar epimerase